MIIRLLLRFLYFLFLIFIIRAFIRYLFPGSPKGKTPNPPSPPSPGSSSKVISGHMEKDPICGMYIDTQTALHTDRGGKSFYFCSEGCQKKFIASTP
ncbi:MAG: YHS domain-containing protein [Acidobacteriia bacterium]|nr:YHS domain-containing protein [Terriglobia bacterium]